MRRVVPVVVGVLLAISGLPLLPATPAGAAPPTPVYLAPGNTSTVDANPVFRWQPSTGALRYLFEISQNELMTPLVAGGSIATTNTAVTFPTELPSNVQLYWRVTAYDTPSGPGGAAVGPTWRVSKNFIATPTGLNPDPSAVKVFKYPSEAPTFSWAPVPGAKEYEISVASDENFINRMIPAGTKTVNASFTLSSPFILDTTYFWRVKAFATDNSPSGESVTGKFRSEWRNPNDTPMLPETILPANQNDPAIEEVVFRWKAIPGAEQYDVQWSLSSLFTSPTTVRVKSTQYSPPVTLDDKAFFWKVRGVTTTPGTGSWSNTATFNRKWPATDPSPEKLGSIKLLTPPDSAVDPAGFEVNEPVFSWTPQRLGSRYQLDLSTDPNFTSNVQTCVTTHTTVTPFNACGISPVPNAFYYWRVKAYDDPKPVEGDESAVSTFIYRPILVTQTGPPNGTATSAPLLTWNPDPTNLTGRYRISIWNELGQLAKQVDTYNISLVPPLNTSSVGSYAPDALSILPAENLHTWKVQTLDISGRPGPMPATGRTFAMVAPTPTATAPNVLSPNNAQGTRVPPMSWEPVIGADRYNVKYSVFGANLYSTLVSDWRSTSYAHQTSSVAPGVYDWFVEAENAAGVVISRTQIPSPLANSKFEVKNFLPSQAVSPLNCTTATCAEEYDTPTLDWLPVVGATHYKVYIAYNPAFTSMVPGTPFETSFSQLTPHISLPDNQADLAYYWYARPCYSKSPERCGPEPSTFNGQNPSPVWAFQKQSNTLPLKSPLNNATVGSPNVLSDTNPAYTPGSQITFSWDGFLQTNCKNSQALPTPILCMPPDPTIPRPTTPPPVVTQEAKQYRIEVSDRADFSTVVDAAEVDQLTYTAFDKTYPEGRLYWRVAPIDGSGNRLAWSQERTFVKESPPMTLAYPLAGASVTTGVPTLRVTPKPFEAEWEFEIYKNVNEFEISAGTRVFLKRTSVPAATPTAVLPTLAPGEEYGWRVRRLDASDRYGAWSADDNDDLERFTMGGQGITLRTPSSGATVPANGVFYEWDGVNQATRYKLEVNTQQDFLGTKPEADVITVPTVPTTALQRAAWAPRVTYADGVYWWRVSTLDSAGNVLTTSAPSTFNIGEQGSRYTSIPPVRVVDSRIGLGWNGRLTSTTPRTLKVAGPGLRAPDGAAAVVLNVTAVESNAQSYMTVYPTGTQIPNPGSALNFDANQVIPNLVTVKVGTNGSVNFATNVGNVDVVADIVGYYDLDEGDRYNSLTPFRLLDSRNTGTEAYWSPAGKLGDNQTRSLQVTGRGGVPGDAKAAIVNITAVQGSLQSFMTAFPTGEPKPTASNLNFLGGQIIPNLAIVKIGTGGKITLYNNSGLVDVIVDVVGYFDSDAGSYFHPLAPNRILDTRVNNGLNGAFAPGQIRSLQVSTRGGVPAGATAVVMNTTAVQGTAQTYLMVYPDNAQKPEQASNLNAMANQIIPNLVTVGLSPNGYIRIYNNLGSINVLGDVTGYYSPY